MSDRLRFLALTFCTCVLTACASVPIPIGLNTPQDGLEWVDASEVATLKSMLDFAVALPKLSDDQRQDHFRRLSNLDETSRSPSQNTRLALLLGGVDDELTDYPAAISALQRASFGFSESPLLSAFVREKLKQFEILDSSDQQLKTSQRRNRELRRLQRRTERQIADRTAVDDGDSGDASASAEFLLEDDKPLAQVARELAESEWNSYTRQLLYDLQSAQQQLTLQTDTINEQNNQIAVLEAKIKALSAIESSLNQREE